MLGAADAAFRLAAWHDFAVMLGGAAAALTGLVFVAASIQLGALSRDARLRQQATSSLLFLFTIVAAAAAILAPQSPPAVGAEFLVLVLSGALFGNRGLRQSPHQQDRVSRMLLAVQLPTGILGIVADVSLIAERGYGMYLAAPCLVITLGVTVASAWLVLSAAASEAEEASGPD